MSESTTTYQTTNENYAEKQLQNVSGYVGCKNITDSYGEGRSTNLFVTIGENKGVFIPPGKSIPMPVSIFNKLKNGRDVHGNLCWKEVPLSQCDNRQSTYEYHSVAGQSVDKIDDTLVQNVRTFADIDTDVKEIESYIGSIFSEATIKHIISTICSDTKYTKEYRQALSSACIKRLDILRKGL